MPFTYPLTYVLTAVCAAAEVKSKPVISTDVNVLGVTSVGDRLFVLLNQQSNQVAVYYIDCYRPQPEIDLPDLKPHVCNDIVACVPARRLFVSDYLGCAIHRYDLADCVPTRWSTGGCPRSVSVTACGNLLVTFWHKSADKHLVEISAESGLSMREIALPPEIEYPAHALQLAAGPLLVCLSVPTPTQTGYSANVIAGSASGKSTSKGYGASSYFTRPSSVYHWVCAVDGFSQVHPVYPSGDGVHCSGVPRCPFYLAADNESQSVFVAETASRRADPADGDDDDDAETGRLAVLRGPMMQFVRYISEQLARPTRLHFDQAKRRLYVVVKDRDIFVVQL